MRLASDCCLQTCHRHCHRVGQYNSPIWSPRYVYLKDKLESVQRRFTKRLNGFGHISYAARPDRLKAETLELKRWKSDLTRMFSIIRRFLLILIVTAYSMSLTVSPFTLVVIILDCISSTVMLTAVWTLLSAATLMSGTGYQLMSWTVTVSQYLSIH